jgi:acyl-CoA synthetase (NDP forming)
VPAFPDELQRKLTAMIPSAGASARNPVDVANPFPPPAMLRTVLETVCEEADIDTIIVDEIEMSPVVPRPATAAATGVLGAPAAGVFEELMRVPVDIKEKYAKPVVAVMPVEAVATAALPGEGERRKVRDFLHQHGIPVFLTLERAATALANLTGYYRRRADLAAGG